MAHRPAFEETLPADYREIRRIDATVPRTGAIFNILALIPLVIAVLPVVMRYSFDDFMASPYSIHAFFLLTVSLIGYIFLHELTHGLAYKLLTGKRLTFGLSWSCAFCPVHGAACAAVRAGVPLRRSACPDVCHSSRFASWWVHR